MTKSLDSLVEWLIDNGHAGKLLGMLWGESQYADFESLGSLDRHSRILISMAAQHLEFIERFGNIYEDVKVDGKIYFPLHEYFLAWRLALLPGVSHYQLERLCKDLGMPE